MVIPSSMEVFMTATDLLKIVDTVAALNQSVLHESNSVGNTTNRLIVAVEQVADRVALPEGTVRLQTNSTVLQVWNLTAAAPPSFLGLLLKSDGELVNVTSVSNQSVDTDTAILLPGEVGHNIVEAKPGRDVRLSASVITQTSLFRTVEQADTADTDTSQVQTTEDRPTARARLNSKVISLRITVDGEPVTDLTHFGQGNVTTVFQPLQTISTRSEAERRERTQCVFWDFAEREGRGAWSTEGCHLERFVAEKTVCLCNHLTNFAILMDFYGQSVKTIKLHESILSSITMGGLTVSIGALFLTLLAFIFVRKLHKSLPQQALFNLSLAMLISWVLFLAGVKRVGSHVTCLLVAILLHYFILVTFLWMLVQGALHYVMLFKGRRQPSTPRFMLKAGLVAWGLPALPVIIVSAIDVELYHGGDRYCWMSLTPFYYAFLVPVAIIVTTNIVIYVLVVISICRRPKISSVGSNYTAIGVRASISCFVVLGLSWVFAFFAVEDARLVFQYLFTCTTAIQGLVIFIMYPARDPDVRAFCLQTFGRRGGSSAQQQQVIPIHRRVQTSGPEMSPSSEPERASGSECVVKTASTGETGFAPSK
ncbi:putative adhesion G protein-coupled receptor E4P [Babylonia areolata]|uniref:putative adhesion G protein-coupled receptor E4P n=1 Tax=Babylonia areolata TaxID=304850 RepID=UPI003FD1F7B8